MGKTVLFSVEALTRPGLTPTSFTLDAGTCATIRGKSGSGKSLLLRALADLDPCDGVVRLNGIDRATVPAPDWRKRVAFVPAESGWWAATVGEHMADPVAAGQTAQRLSLSGDAMDWPISRLSTGEKQRLSLVRALQGAPPVLLLDEPTSGLDPDAREKTEALIRDACADGAAVIVVSHDPDQAARLGATMQFRMESGVLTRETPP